MIFNPIHPIGNSLKKQKSMYRVLTTSYYTLNMKSPKLMGVLWAYTDAIGCIELNRKHFLQHKSDSFCEEYLLYGTGQVLSVALWELSKPLKVAENMH